MGDFDLGEFLKEHEKSIQVATEVGTAASGAFQANQERKALSDARDSASARLTPGQRPEDRQAIENAVASRKRQTNARRSSRTILTPEFGLSQANVSRKTLGSGRKTLLGGVG